MRITWLLVLLFYSTNGEVKVRFNNEPSRPVRSPEDEGLTRRTFWRPKDVLCGTIGATAGSLIAHRLTESGSLSNGETLPNHNLLNLRSLITMLTLNLIPRLATNCPKTILKTTAIEMCNSILCALDQQVLPRETSISIALSTYGVLDAIPSLLPFKLQQPNRDCLHMLYNLKLDNDSNFHRNPQLHVLRLIQGLDVQVEDIQKTLRASNIKPLDIPPIQPYEYQNYMQAAVHGTVIASHLIKSIAKSGRITIFKKFGDHDATSLITSAGCRLIRDLQIRPANFAYRTHNIVLKMTLYWVINNQDLIKTLDPHEITLESLKKLGLAAYFPSTPRLQTNDQIVHPIWKFLTFEDITENLETTVQILIQRLDTNAILQEIEELLPNHQITIPDEVISMEVVPVPGTAISIQHTRDMLEDESNSLGALPDPSKWFATDAPAQNASKNANVVYLGTLAVVIGTHASRVLPEMGLITSQDDPGYRNMERMDVYQTLQNIIQRFIAKLMTIVPLSLDDGFYLLNAAFKSSKLSLNLPKLQKNMMIPVTLKHYDLLQFHPQLQHIKFELWPVPNTLQVLYLWTKPGMGVNLTQAMGDKIQERTHSAFPGVLNDIIEIFKYHMPGLSLYNLKDLSKKSGEFFKWDPENAMSFLYHPETSDGTASESFGLIDAPHTPIDCPGHIFCPPHPCKKSGCGFYACDSRDPWCYYPPGIKCPGTVSCPVFINHDDHVLSCPTDKDCPIVDIQCPGAPECPNASTVCPGSSACPLSIKCPGALCPNRFTSRPQTLLPCPQHPSCSRPSANQVACINDQSCNYSPESDVAVAIKQAGQNIAEIINKKESILNISNYAVSKVSVNGKSPSSSGSAVAKAKQDLNSSKTSAVVNVNT